MAGREYAIVVADQTKVDQQEMASFRQLEKRASTQAGVAFNADNVWSIYPERTGKNLLQRFKKAIAPDVMKFIAITEANPIESGENQAKAEERWLRIYKLRYGKDFHCFACWDYLKEKPKWASFQQRTEKKNEDKLAAVKKERPIGKKKAQREEAIKKIAAKVVKDGINDMVKSSGMATAAKVAEAAPTPMYDMLSSHMGEVGECLNTLKAFMMEQSLTEEQKRVVREQNMELIAMEHRNKKKKLEMQYKEMEDSKKDDGSEHEDKE